MSDIADSDDQRPTVAEVAALLRRIREVSGPDTDPADRAEVIAEKQQLLRRLGEVGR